MADYIIGIGAQKAGTTWLSDYLDKHPEICFSPRKELHYFDAMYAPELSGKWNNRFKAEQSNKTLRKRMKWILATGLVGKNSVSYSGFLNYRIGMINDPAEYTRYFEKINRGQKYNAEVTPSYSILGPEGFKAMKDLLGDRLKLIFMMRNPADRFWSNMRHIQKGDESFDPQEAFRDRLENQQNIRRTDYKRTIESLESIFPAENILYLFYESLFGMNGEECFKALPEFLGIEAIAPDLGKRVNKSVSNTLTSEKRAQIATRFKDVYHFVIERFGEDVPESWKKDYSEME